MHESIYHVYANYCGERRLLFAGYASRVARRLGIRPSDLWMYNQGLPMSFAPTTDRFGNQMPYQLWTGPAELIRIPNPEMEIVA